MKGFPVLLATLLVSGALALAQVCPPGYTTSTGAAYGAYPMVSTIGAYPMVSSVPSVIYPTGVSTSAATVTSPICPNAALSPGTACLLNEMEAVRGQILASQLTMQGQSLTSRMNALQAQESAFRQALATNPNLPNAQLMALQLTAEANQLNRDIAAFNTTVSMVPVAQRPFIAQQMNTFDVAYWQPTVQQFSAYQASLPAMITTYQPAVAANPWLQPWFTSYQASIGTVGQTQQVFASTRWWAQPTAIVSGTTEVFPVTGGSYMMLPSGAVIYIPPNMAATTGTMVPMGTMGTVGNAGITGTIDGTAY